MFVLYELRVCFRTYDCVLYVMNVLFMEHSHINSLIDKSARVNLDEYNSFIQINFS